MNKKTVNLTREFGRVIRHPDRHEGAPFLNGTNVLVQDILNLLNDGADEKDILATYPQLDKEHIAICKAYQVRFMAHEQVGMEHINPDEKFFMLDENTSYMLLYDVARIFGWSSHVFADGLYNENNDDEANIWKHMVENGYKAIITEDSDFKRISRNFRRKVIEQYGSIENAPFNVPVVIFISKNCSREDVAARLEAFKDKILEYITDNDAAFATLSVEGFQKSHTDEELETAQNPVFHAQGRKPS